MSKDLILFLTVICVAYGIEIPKDYKYDECSPDKTECTYWLYVKEKLTMIYVKDLVYPHEGKLYRYDEKPGPNATYIPIEEVVTVDGANRMVISVNGTVPGPPIVAYEGQILTVIVKNLMLSDVVTIHWHGMHQKDTPFMDGVGWISQCPIGSGQTFTYKFKAEPKGTFWYHSHVGAQRTNGVYGALIIKERPKSNADLPTDIIMSVGDWHHVNSEEVYVKMVFGNFIGRDAYTPTKTQDGGKFSGVPWVSALIEGKGRYIDPKSGEHNGAPLTWYNVTKGSTYRFRVINVGTIYPMRISVDDHDMTVVASDGYDLEPFISESLNINPGERFDFILETNHDSGNYWIRAVSLESDVLNHTVEAILHYSNAPQKEPLTSRRECTVAMPCKVVNCPFLYYPMGTNIECVLMSDLFNADKNDPAPSFEEGSEEHFLNFAFPGTSVTPGAVNGHKFEFPGVNSLTQDEEIANYECDKHECGPNKVCYCHYQLDVPFNKTIQMVLSNIGRGGGWGHPIHLHGHSFYVLKMDYAPQNMTTGKLIDALNNKDLACDGGLGFCNEPRWKNNTWSKGNAPGMNLKNPPRKDTIILPTGGYAIIRIRSDNPGKWFMHCHIEVHALDGMAMILSEAIDRAPKAPKGFPVCNNFYNDLSRDFDYKLQEACVDTTPYVAAIIILSILLAVAVIVLTAICCIKRKHSPRKSNTTVLT